TLYLRRERMEKTARKNSIWRSFWAKLGGGDRIRLIACLSYPPTTFGLVPLAQIKPLLVQK
ncbi:hypothetical protein J7J24_00550, partial [bacterium]|nr:hypothetical protein [bacterium]